MDNQDQDSLEQRIRKLENGLADLRLLVKQLLDDRQREQATQTKPVEQVASPPPPIVKETVLPPKPEPVHVPPAPPKPKSGGFSFELPAHMKKIEFWLNKVGIALLLFAVAFLFKYSIDKGWLTPWVRVLFGLLLGVVLVTLGYRTYGKRRHFSLVFFGGGIATFYITAFAAFQRLEIVSHPVAFGFMVLVTLFALLLSLKQNDSILSLLGAIGGFGTPFMLYTGSGDIPALMLYTGILIAATSAIYFYRGWRSLLWLTVFSGWIVIFVALAKGMNFGRSAAPGDRLAMEIGTLFAFAVFWIIPVLREVARAVNPAKWLDPWMERETNASSEFAALLRGQPYYLAISSPLIALALSVRIWPDVPEITMGWYTMVGALVYWLASVNLYRRTKLTNLAYTHVLVGALLFTIALCMLLKGDTLFFAIAAEATVLHLVAHRTNITGYAIGGHVLFGILTMVLVIRLGGPQTGTRVILNSLALADLFGIACALGLSFVFRPAFQKRIYFLIAYLALAAWFNRELDGNLLFAIIVAQSVVLHMLTIRSRDNFLQLFSHAFSASVGIWLVERIVGHAEIPPPMINIQAITSLWGIAAFAGIWRLLKLVQVKQIYFLVAYFILAGWFCRELDGNTLFIVLTVQAFGLHLLARRKADDMVRIGAHVFSILLGVWLIERMFDRETTAAAILNVFALASFAAIFMLAVVAWLSKIGWERLGYAITAHVLFMGWLLSELSTVNDGQGYVTIAWGVYGALLLIIGLRRNDHRVRITALITLFAVVAKLFLVDLAHLEAIFRILLFMGFGAVFLALSYYFRSLWKSDAVKSDNHG